MNILVLAQNYPPDHSAGAFRIKAIVDVLIEQGHHVSVLTGSLNRFDPCGSCDKCNKACTFSGEDVVRIRSLKDYGGIWKRGLGYSLFFLDALPKTLRIARKSDVILATTPQILIGFLGGIASKLTGVPFILDVRDLWPDVMYDMGVLTKESRTYKILKQIELFLYRQADQIIVNSPAFVSHVTGLCEKRPEIITNGLDDRYFTRIQNIHSMEKHNPYYVTYAGNIGIAQHLQPVIEAAEKFKGKLIFRFIGQGSDLGRLKKIKSEKNITNIEFIEPVAREELINYYARTDAFLVHLKDIPMFKKTIPSKIFEYVATGKPVVYGLSGVSEKMMDSFQGDLLKFQPDNLDSLVKSLKNLVSVMEEKTPWNGEKGITMIRQNYLRSDLSRNFAKLIETCGEEYDQHPVCQNS